MPAIEVQTPPVGDQGRLTAREQTRVLFKSQKISLPVNCVLAATAAFALYDPARENSVGPWFALVCVVNIVRYVLAVNGLKLDGLKLDGLKAASEKPDCRLLLRLSAGGAIAGSLSWSFIPMVFMDPGRPSFSVLVAIICGLTAGATVQGACHASTTVAFVVPLLVATIGCLLLDGSTSNIILAFDMVLYMTLLVKSSFTAQAAFCAAFHVLHKSEAANAELYQLANRDPLTALLNRAAFSATLNSWLQRARVQTVSFSLLLLDLDHFKSINDTMGHGAGDEVLKAVAARLIEVVSVEHAVARLGGDEFAILLLAGEGPDSDESVAGRIIQAVSAPVVILDLTMTLGVSIGVASFPEDCARGDDLLLRADLALYAAKKGGRQRFCRFDDSLLAAVELARDIANDLTDALASGEIQVWYQPQIALAANRMVGLEALIRWNHPQHGWISPPAIVSAALQTHSSRRLTEFVLGRACAMVQRLADMGLSDVLVAVNVSPTELGRYDLADLLSQTLTTHGVGAEHLEIELTEEALVDGKGVVETLETLSAMGIRLAIDDFGTGCSSLAYLRTLKVGRIKIDRSFVTGFRDREDDRILVQAILGIGRSLKIEVVAEGVETAAEAELLAGFGCVVAQGYHFGRPMSPDALDAWIVRWGIEQREAVPLLGYAQDAQASVYGLLVS